MSIDAAPLRTPTSDLSLPEIEAYSPYGRLFEREPLKALELLCALWEHQKGLPVDPEGELCNMLFVLVLCFNGQFGYTTEDGSPPTTFPSAKGPIWEACLTFELPLVLLDMIKDKTFFKQPFKWIQAVLAMSSVMSSTWAQRTGSCNFPQPVGELEATLWPSPSQPLAEKYCEQVGAVWDLLWDERDLLLPLQGAARDDQTWIAPILVVFAYTVVNLHTYRYTEYQNRLTRFPSILRLTLQAFVQMSTSPDSRAQLLLPQQQFFPFLAVIKYRTFIFASTDSDLTAQQKYDIWRLTIDMAVENIGPLKFIRACHNALSSWPAMTNTNLRSILLMLEHMLIFHNENEIPKGQDLKVPVRRAYWETPMLPVIAEALERESLTPPVNHYGRANTCVSGCYLIQFTMQGFLYAKMLPAMDGRSGYKILASCLLMLCDTLEFEEASREDGNDTGMNAGAAVEGLAYSCTSWVRMCKTGLDLANVNQAQTAALRRVERETKLAATESWYNDMRSLRSHRERLSGNSGYQSLVKLWLAFGKAFGLKETVERDQHDARNKHICSWTLCEFHLQPSPMPLFTCTGCGEQRYCSRACQKRCNDFPSSAVPG